MDLRLWRAVINFRINLALSKGKDSSKWYGRGEAVELLGKTSSSRIAKEHLEPVLTPLRHIFFPEKQSIKLAYLLQ